MSELAPSLRSKLFGIASRTRSYSDHPAIIQWKEYGPLSAEELFAFPERRRILELGSGWGEFAIAWCRTFSDSYVAMEIKPDRIHATLKKIDRFGLSNLRILPVNFEWFLEELLPAQSFDGIIVNFPDPWPKKRHWKHRLIQDAFPKIAHSLTRPGAFLHIATDHGPYSRRILQRFRKSPDLWSSNMNAPGYSLVRPEGIPETYFERVQSRLGYRPRFMQWRRIDGN